jgi:signal transduction histidine kinase
MPSGLRDRVLGSTSARMTASFGAVLLISFALAAGVAWVLTRSLAEQQVRERIQLEMDALQSEIRLEGTEAAVAAIRARTESPGALEYLFTDAAGQPLVNDLAVSHAPLGWSLLDRPEPAGAEQGADDFVLLSAATPDGGRLTIGDDLSGAEQVRDAVLGAILWVGAGALALVMAAGVFLARGAMRRVQALSTTLTRVSAGDLSARAPESAGGDDLDRISRGVNSMLTRIDALVANTRRVSADIAHDLRTPLTHVQQLLETAASSEPQAAKEAARAAQAKIDEVLRTFTAMLRLAEIEAGAGKRRFTEVDLGHLVEGVGDAYRHDIEASGHGFTVTGADDVPVTGDGDLLQQALANLLENAMRHAGAGAAIALRAERHGEGARLVVEDRGAGIMRDDRDRALEPFARLDAARSSPGAGLGLSIVSAIARLHDAKLTLEDAQPGLRVVISFGTPSPRVATHSQEDALQ